VFRPQASTLGGFIPNFGALHDGLSRLEPVPPFSLRDMLTLHFETVLAGNYISAPQGCCTIPRPWCKSQLLDMTAVHHQIFQHVHDSRVYNLRVRDCLNINRDLAWPFVTDCQGVVSGELQPVYRTEWDHN